MTRKVLPNFLLNDRGMSIPLIMVLATVGALIVLSMSDTVLSSVGLMSSRGQVVSYETFVENMRNIMEDPTACTEMLEGIQVDLTGPQAAAPFVSSREVLAIDANFNEPTSIPPVSTDTLLYSSPDAGNIKKGWRDPQNQFGIDRMEIEIIGGEAMRLSQKPYDHAEFATPTVDPGVQKAFPARFIFYPSGIGSKILRESQLSDARFENSTSQKFEDKKKYKFEDATGEEALEHDKIDIRIFVNVTDMGGGVGFINSCYGYKSVAAVCAAAGGTYQYEDNPSDPSYIQDLKCRPWKKCFQSPDGLVDSPAQCPKPYDVNIDQVGVAGAAGTTKYLCSWCHPWPYDKMGLSPTGGVTAKTLQELEDMWMALIGEVVPFMTKNPDPTNIPLSDQLKSAELMTRWTHLEELTKQLNVASDDTSVEYQQAKTLYDSYLSADTALKDTQASINGYTNDIGQLEDLIDGAKAVDSAYGYPIPQSGLDTLQSNVDSTQAAYDADPSSTNLADLDEAKAELAAAQMYNSDPNLLTTLQTQYDQAQADLAAAQSSLSGVQSTYDQALADKNAWTSPDGLTVDQFLDPIQEVRDYLVTQYGVDQEIIVYMDDLRAL